MTQEFPDPFLTLPLTVKRRRHVEVADLVRSLTAEMQRKYADASCFGATITCTIMRPTRAGGVARDLG